MIKNIIYIFSYIFYVVILIIFMISWWKLNEKMNRKGWVCLIPVYNILCLFEDVFGKKVYCLLLLLPFINFVLFLILIYKLGRVFGKKPSYGILMILFPYVFIPILAFDDSKYLGPVKNNNKKSK